MDQMYRAPRDGVLCCLCTAEVQVADSAHLYAYGEYTGETYCRQCWENRVHPVLRELDVQPR